LEEVKLALQTIQGLSQEGEIIGVEEGRNRGSSAPHRTGDPTPKDREV
jgi:hypothetical protein